MIFNIFLAYLYMSSGFWLFAGFYYLRKNCWNGFSNKNKVIVSGLIMLVVSILLISSPELSETLKLLTGLDVNIENSKVGFMTIGFSLAGTLSSKLSDTIKNEKIDE